MHRNLTLFGLSAVILLAVLVAGALAVNEPDARGVPMSLLSLRHADGISCDGRFIFVELREDGSARVNGEPMRDGDLQTYIGRAMETRAERVVYLVPRPGIGYGRFVNVLNALEHSADDIHVGVLSGAVRDAYVGQGSASQWMYQPCDLVWPKKELLR